MFHLPTRTPRNKLGRRRKVELLGTFEAPRVKSACKSASRPTPPLLYRFGEFAEVDLASSYSVRCAYRNTFDHTVLRSSMPRLRGQLEGAFQCKTELFECLYVRPLVASPGTTSNLELILLCRKAPRMYRRLGGSSRQPLLSSDVGYRPCMRPHAPDIVSLRPA
jgi:hypothetical protein